ncbi:MAG: hypothetical protein AB1405_02645 [Bdellovibrionota bacterium]
MVQDSASKRLKTAILLTGLYGAVLGLVLAGFEVYLRRSTTYIVTQDSEAKGPREIGREGLLYYGSDGGRRLLKSARATIKNNILSGLDVEIVTNSHGFRDQEIPDVKQPGEIRILVLGDSITWGDYLPASQVYVERSQHHLANLTPGRTAEVINAGVGAIGLREEINILMEEGLQVHPDIVVNAFYLNDSRPPTGFSEEPSQKGPARILSWLRRHSVLADQLYKTMKTWKRDRNLEKTEFRWITEDKRLDWKKDPGDFQELARLARFDWGAAWDESSWTLVDEEYARLRSLAKQHGFQVVTAALPVRYQVEAEFLEDLPQRTLQKKAAEAGFGFIDFLPFLREHRGEHLFFDQCHLTVEGNEIAGKALAEFLAPRIASIQTTLPSP